jgi:hypothetical protein
MSKGELIGSIVAKVRKLVDENRRLKGEGVELRGELEKSRGENRELKDNILHLEKRLKKLELREGLGGDKGARTRVNQLIREVDKCIALLNR